MNLGVQAAWYTLLSESPLKNNSKDEFVRHLRAFFAIHATDDDRHDLLEQMHNCRKPIAMKPHSFYYRLLDFNEYVQWLPGMEPQLTQSQLEYAFFNAMPPTWKEKFANAGRSVLTEGHVKLVRYFKLQQILAITNQQRNNKQQKREALANKHRPSIKQPTFKTPVIILGSPSPRRRMIPRIPRTSRRSRLMSPTTCNALFILIMFTRGVTDT